MDKKWIVLFIIFLVSLLAIGSVGAADLANRDFDGYFSMLAPKNATFQKDINVTNESGMETVSVLYTNNDLAIMYYDTPAFSENSSAYLYQIMFEGLNPNLNKCYESHHGNLTLLEPMQKNDLTFSLGCISEGNKVIMIAGQDADLIKRMGMSVEFK